MTQPAPNAAADPLALTPQRDLALVLGENLPQQAAEPLEPSDAELADWAAWLKAAHSPVIAGIHALSNQGVEAAVELARRCGAMLYLDEPTSYPDATAASPSSGSDAPLSPPLSHPGFPPSVAHVATLGHACSAEMIVWIGCDGAATPITRFISRDQLLGSFVPPSLDAVLNLRQLMRHQPESCPLTQHTRVTAVLAHDVDPRVAAQWHRLAGEVQNRVRLSVLALPHPEAKNRRGAIEVTTWLTGRSPEHHGLDFAQSPARPAPPLAQRVAHGGCDTLIDCGLRHTAALDPRPPRLRAWIALRPENPGAADAHQPATGLAWHTHAAVTRFDGLMIRLFDPATTTASAAAGANANSRDATLSSVPPDPVSRTLQRLAARLAD